MGVFALLSAGGSPGVTTSALALTLSWPSQVILAECDPSGGDVLAGLLRGHLTASSGLLPLALEAGAGAEIPADTLWRQLIELDEEHNRLLLAGISDPRQSAALQSSLPWIAEALQGMKADVIADCGRLDAVAAVRPVLSAASLAVLVLRPTLRQVSRAVPRIEMLANLVGRERVVTLLVGEGTASGREIAKTLGVPVAGEMPDDGKTAAVLSDGSGRRHRLEARALIRAATVAGRALREAAEAAGPLLGYADQVVYAQPGLAQPALGQPGLAQPGLAQSGLAQSGLAQPPLGQPGLGRTELGQPSLGQPSLYQPRGGQPDHRQLGLGHPDDGHPDDGHPDDGHPDDVQPDDVQPDHVQPDHVQPGLGGLDRLGFGQFGLGQPDGAESGGAESGGTQSGGTQYGNAQNGSRP